MIKTNELRLGNLFQDKFSKDYFKVLELTEGAIVFDYFTDKVWQAEPIELTEEILLKCPYIENRNTNPKSYYLHNRIIFINDNICYDYATRVKLPYLHTFQNFIFALTGEELEIKL